jgi:hypothetical protein
MMDGAVIETKSSKDARVSTFVVDEDIERDAEVYSSYGPDCRIFHGTFDDC